MKYLRKEIEYKPWRITLVLAVLFVAMVLGVVQRIDQANQEEPPEFINQSETLNEETCTNSGGEWDSCGSACRGEEAEDPEVICAEVCVDHCYCAHDGECPEGHHCTEFIEETGICVIDF